MAKFGDAPNADARAQYDFSKSSSPTTVQSIDASDFDLAGTDGTSSFNSPSSSSNDGPAGQRNDPRTLGYQWILQWGPPYMHFLWNPGAATDQLIGFRRDGARFIFQLLNGVYYLTEIRGLFDNSIVYFLAPNGSISAIREDGIETRYIRLSPDVIEERRYIYPNQRYEQGTGVYLPQFNRTLTYSRGKLIMVEAWEATYVDYPSNSNRIIDTSVSHIGREIWRYFYDSVSGNIRLVTIESPSGGPETVLGVSWRRDNNLWKVAQTTDGDGTVRTFAYHPDRVVVSDTAGNSPVKTFEYLTDAYDRFTEVIERPAFDPRAGDSPGTEPERHWKVEFAEDCSCSDLVKRTEYSVLGHTVSTWHADIDLSRGLVRREYTPSPTGAGEEWVDYEYGEFVDGSPLLAVIRSNGTSLTERAENSRNRVASWDEGMKPIYVVTETNEVTSLSGAKTKLRKTTTYDRRGREILTRSPTCVATRYAYDDADGSSGRGVLTNVTVGPSGKDGEPDLSSEETSRVRIVRNSPLSLPTAIFTGPASIHTAAFSYDDLGRTTEALMTPGQGAPPSRSRFFYDAQGNLVVTLLANVDETGAAQRDAQGQGGGRPWLRFESRYDSRGRITDRLSDIAPLYAPESTSISDANAYQRVRFSYDQRTGMVSEIAAALGTIRYSWDGYRELYTTQRLGGPVLSKLYSVGPLSLNRAIARMNPTSGAPEYAETRAVAVDNGSGALHHIEYPNGWKESVSYNRQGQPERIAVSASGRVLTSKYTRFDELGRAIEVFIENPKLGGSTRIHAAEFAGASLKATFDPHGLAASYAYTPLGALASVRGRAGVGIEFDYVPGRSGLVAREKRQNGTKEFWTDYEYDAAGRVVRTAFTGFDGAQPARESRLFYNSLGQVSAAIGPDGVRISSSIDPLGLTWWSRRDTSTPTILRASRSIDSTRKQVNLSKFDVMGLETRALYDALGLRSLTFPGRPAQTFEFDEARHLTRAVLQDGTEATFGYDRLGRKEFSTVKAQGSLTPDVTRRVVRNVLDQVESTEETDATGVKRIGYRYDDYGNLEEERFASPVLATPHLVTLNRQIGGAADGAYDFGAVHAVTLSSGGDSVTWRARRDNEQRLRVIELSGLAGLPQVAATFEYDGSTVTRFTRANGMASDITYDGYGLLKSVFSTMNGQLVDGYEVLERDVRQFITKVAQPTAEGIGSRFQYDEQGRITNARFGLLDVAQFQTSFAQANAARTVHLDYVGASQLRRQRITTSSSGTTTDTYDYDSATGLLRAFNGTPFRYDGADRITQGTGGKRYGYNVLGRMTSIEDSSGNPLVGMSYDMHGRLQTITNVLANDTTTQGWFGQTRYMTEDRQGEKTVFLPYPGVPDENIGYWKESSGTFTGYYPTVGSNYSAAKVFTDGSTTPIEEFTYSFDGKPTSHRAGGTPPSGGDNRFLGMQQLPDGTYHVRARQYDAESGHFLQRDPRYGAAGNGDSAQSFVGNNPGNWRDPSGKQRDSMRLFLDHYASNSPGMKAARDLYLWHQEIESYNPGDLTVEERVEWGVNPSTLDVLQVGVGEILDPFLQTPQMLSDSAWGVLEMHPVGKLAAAAGGAVLDSFPEEPSLVDDPFAFVGWHFANAFGGQGDGKQRSKSVVEMVVSIGSLTWGLAKGTFSLTRLEKLRPSGATLCEFDTIAGSPCRWSTVRTLVEDPPSRVAELFAGTHSQAPLLHGAPWGNRARFTALDLRIGPSLSADYLGIRADLSRALPLREGSQTHILIFNPHFGGPSAPNALPDELLKLLDVGGQIHIVGHEKSNGLLRSLVESLSGNQALQAQYCGEALPPWLSGYIPRYTNGNPMPADAAGKLLYWLFQRTP